MSTKTTIELATYRRVVDVTGAMTVFGIAAVGVLLVPVWFDAARVEHEAERQKLQRLAAGEEIIREDLEKAETELNELETRLDRAIARVPETANEAEFLAEVVEVFESAGVVLRHYRTGRPVKKDSHHELDVTIEGTCDYPGLCRTLAGLADSPRAGRVVGLSVDLGSRDTVQLDFELTWRLYSRPTEVARLEGPNRDRR